MFKALFYPKDIEFYKDNVVRSVTNSMDPPQLFELQMCECHKPINILQPCETKNI